MIASGLLEGAAALIVAIISMIFVFGQVKESARKNEEDINEIKEMITNYQEDTRELLAQNMQDFKEMLDDQKKDQNQALQREIQHIRENWSLNISEIREDIRRLENSQNQNVRMREEIIWLRSAVKSLHHRLNIDPPVLFDED